VVTQDARVTRNAFQRVYDMILSYGTDTYEVAREKRLHYKFFPIPITAAVTPCLDWTRR